MAHIPTQRTFSSTPLLKDIPASVSITSLRSGETINRDEIELRVAARSKSLAETQIRPASRIVIGLSDPLECLICLFSSWVSGHCAVLVNPALSDDEKKRVIRKVRASLWIDDTGWHETGLNRKAQRIAVMPH